MLVLIEQPGGELARARVELVRGQHPLFEQEALERRQPALVVPGRVAVPLRLGNLQRQPVPEVIPGELPAVAQGHGHAEDPPLPRRLEDQLAVPARDRQLIAEVLDPSVAHRRTPPCRGSTETFATPIIASRVTRAASSSSVM